MEVWSEIGRLTAVQIWEKFSGLSPWEAYEKAAELGLIHNIPYNKHVECESGFVHEWNALIVESEIEILCNTP